MLYDNNIILLVILILIAFKDQEIKLPALLNVYLVGTDCCLMLITFIAIC